MILSFILYILMDLITHYQSFSEPQSHHKLILSEKSTLFNPTQITYEQIMKIKRNLYHQFKSESLTFLNEENNLDTINTQDKLISNAVLTDNQTKPHSKYQIDIQKHLNFALMTKSKFDNYAIFIIFTINIKTAAYFFSSKLLHNGKVLSAESAPFIKIIARHFMNYNSKYRNGSFYIDPITRVIQLTLANHTTIQIISSLLRNPKQFQMNIKYQIQIIQERWNQCLVTLLYLLNREYIPNNKSEVIKSRITKLTQTVIKSHYDPKQIISTKQVVRFNTVVNRQNYEKQRLYKYNKSKDCEAILEKDSKSIQNILPILQLYLSKKTVKNQQIKYVNLTGQEIKDIIQNLNCLEYVGKFPIYSQIQIFKVNKTKELTETGFSKIYCIDVECQRQCDKTPLQTQLIKKLSQDNRYKKQVEILKIIRNSRCIFFPRYHYCQQEQFKQTILMQFIMESTIERYIAMREKYMSLMTKTFFLFEIVVALSFLRDHSIVHIDLKPQNILLKIVRDGMQQQHFLVKLIDFGESYSTKLKENPNQRGFTIPYAPPELIFRKSHFDQKTDVFSFGIIMYELLFSHFPIQIIKQNKQIFKQKNLEDYKPHHSSVQKLRQSIISDEQENIGQSQKRKNQQEVSYLNFFSLPFEKLDYFGIRDMSLLLYHLCIKCLKPNPEKRPTLDWLALILKQIVLIYEEIAK